jgi:uncharacterized membrane protein
MAIERQASATPGAPIPTSASFHPTTSAEFVNTIAHYYRGEMGRMTSWRDRLDLTTNWAIGAVAAMLSITLASPASHHSVLLFAMLIVFVLLVIEARRYRFFHVFRNRIRMIERYYYARVFAPQEGPDPGRWLQELGEDLRQPRFSVSLIQSLSRRLRRTYCWIFLILLFAWLLKTAAILQPVAADDAYVQWSGEVLRNAGVAGVPGWAVLAFVFAFYGWMVYIMVRYRVEQGELAESQVHV